jgi:hypothetical protein
VCATCWVEAYFGKEGYFGRIHIFGEKVYFGKDLILECAQLMARKQHAEKEGNTTCKEEKQRGAQADKPNYDRVRVCDKDCNGYKHEK